MYLSNLQEYTDTFFTIIVVQLNSEISSSFRTYYSKKRKKFKKLDILPKIWIEISIFRCIFWFWGFYHMWVGLETEMFYWGAIIIHILFPGKIISVSEPTHMLYKPPKSKNRTENRYLWTFIEQKWTKIQFSIQISGRISSFRIFFFF